ncbi:MAG: Uma2 family endonuclease [Minicystis sp.]
MEQASISGGPPRMTIAEWAALPEDEPGELVDGLIVEEEMADLTHETAVVWLLTWLRAWVLGQGGFAFGSEAKYALSRTRGRKPDLTLFLPGRPAPPRRGPVTMPPDLCVEVVSPSPNDRRRDRVIKLDEYARFGVRWYWLLDPESRTLEVLELGPEGRYVHVLGATDGTVSEVPGCPGLSLDLDDLWREIDRLGPEGSAAE